jgi:UPF0271 protein
MNVSDVAPPAAQPSLDLNADLAEGFPDDLALLGLVTSANLSCGAHAGDLHTILTAAQHALAQGVVVGAHPAHPDREHFGRKEISINQSQARTLVLDQVAQLQRILDASGVRVRYVKPHGALYNQAQRDPAIAQGVVQACRELGLPVLGQPRSAVEQAAGQLGVRFLAEGFPDRRYLPDGSLTPRNRPDALLLNQHELELQLDWLISTRQFQTLCIHGDDPHAVAKATHVRSMLATRGIAVRSFLEPNSS